MGLVFQNPDNQLVTTIVEEDVGFGPENLGLPPEQIRARVAEALETVGMAAHAREATYALSGGQKQRVAIAGMLAMQPEVLVLDEATAMLDPRGRQDVLDVVERLHRERGMTVVMITAVYGGGRALRPRRGDERRPPRGAGARRARCSAAQRRCAPPGWSRRRPCSCARRCGRGACRWDGDPITLEELADAICRSLSNN